MSETAVRAGAEPFSAAGGRAGVLVIHGFTGSPHSVRPLAEALAAAGFTVELPLLPGHGTSIEDMLPLGWADWTAAVDEAYADLASRTDAVVVAGLSMGGGLAVWLATRHPEIAGVVAVNPIVVPPDEASVGFVQQMHAEGTDRFPGIGSDIAAPDVTELAYESTPVAPLLSLFEGVTAMRPDLRRVTQPVLLFTSPEDHVVDPVSSDVLAAEVAGPVERVVLHRSYHVATLDHDRDEIERATVAFAQQVTGALGGEGEG